MNWERSGLITFLGNYLNNNIVAAIVAVLPLPASTAAQGMHSPQYITYTLLACVSVALLTMWYGAKSLQSGALFGVCGFVVAIATAFVTGISGVLTQTGSFSQMISILPNFGPFLWNTSTLVLFGYWVIPAALVGMYMGMKKKGSSMSSGSTM